VRRAEGFGIPGDRVDGHDFFTVCRAAQEAVGRMRNGGGPQFLHIEFTRYYGHFEGDAMTYRPPGEVNEERRFLDCLSFFRGRVTSAGLLEGGALDRIDKDVEKQIDAAVAAAKSASPPRAEDLTTDVYKTY
jgi:pyruvate dehydrogenase E1 component alpha subunit